MNSSEMINSAMFEMKKKNFTKALMLYSEAIPNAPDKRHCLSKRCECLMAMNEYEMAISDAKQAIEIDNKHRIAYYHLMNCFILMGEISEAEKVISNFRKIAPQIDTINSNQVAKVELVKTLSKQIIELDNSNKFVDCLAAVNEALKTAPACLEFQVIKLKCLAILRRFDEANWFQMTAKVSEDILKALLFYYDGKLEDALKMVNKIFFLCKKSKSIDDLSIKTRQLTKGFSNGKLNYLFFHNML
jgi:tetratricopeptide (TPR) repeat protein